MARINTGTLVLTVFVLLLVSCKPFKLVQATSNLSWKESWIYKFMDEYVVYDGKYKTICPGEYRDSFFDFARKIQSIREYPFDVVLKGIQEYTVSNKIEFDSVLMENLSDPIFETIDYSCPNTYFSFVRKGNVITYAVGLDFCEKVLFIEEIDRNMNFDKVAVTRKDGCQIGYSSYTWFDKKWKWKITKISINPDNAIKSD